MSSSDSVGAGSIPAGITPRLSTTPCEGCEEFIPQNRMDAVPTATQCVSCLEKAGDVPQYKRFDEAVKDGQVETMFVQNAYIEHQMRRVNTIVPPDAAYETAVGDDSFLVREGNEVVGSAYNITEAFEEDEEEKPIIKAKTDHVDPFPPKDEDDEDSAEFPIPMIPPPDGAIMYATA
jgi:hypothetical protein